MARCESRSNRVSHSNDSFGFSPSATTRPHNAFAGRRISVVVVDDEPIGSNGGAAAFAGPPIQIVGHAPPGPEASALVDRVRPDVVLVTVGEGRPYTEADIDALRARHPETRVLLVEPDRRGEEPARDDAFVHVVARIQQVTARPAGGAGKAARLPTPGMPALTRREHEILRLVALGNTNNEIAQRLGLAANTVKTYWQRALHKLSARNRAEAIARAHDMHLI
jgi:two-component system, NarL family, nitrate/nitrite response regulator NarL